MTAGPLPERADVLIAGARCAGAATALLLARRGARVVVVDPGTYGSDTLSTHALMRGGVVQLARWGLLPAVVASGAPPVRRTIFAYGQEQVAVDISARHGVDALYGPRRTVLDRTLVDGAMASGADVRYGYRLSGLLRDASGRVQGATVIGLDGATHDVHAPLTIGADGRHSTVARHALAPRLRMGRAATATVFGYWPGLPLDAYRWMYGPGAGGGVIPTNDGLSCVFVTVPASTFAGTFGHPVDQGFRRVLQRLDPALGEATRARPEGGFRGFGGAPGSFTRSHGPGWALVGDAGYFRDPLTAHGITDALLHAELLAQAAAAGSDAALAAYERTRTALATPTFDATEAIAAFDWTLDDLRGHHTRLSRAMSAEIDGALAAFQAPHVLAAAGAH